MTNSGSNSSAPPVQPVFILFDTSVLLAMGVKELPAEYHHLLRLKRAGLVTLAVPSIVESEWKANRLESLVKAIDEFGRAGAAVAKLPCFDNTHEHLLELINAASSKSTIELLCEAAEVWVKGRLAELELEVVGFVAANLEAAIGGYFTGGPAFSAKRAKGDLLDAVIYHSVEQLLSQDLKMIFVCSDGRLAKAVRKLGIDVTSSIKELLTHSLVADLQISTKFATWWEREFLTVIDRLKTYEEPIRATLDLDLLNAVAGKTIRDPAIPDDNSEAWVALAGPFDEIRFKWESAESLGEGVLSVPISFEAELELSFNVYRGDAFNVPDWVHVAIGDFETEHYFSASGSRTARYSGRMVIDMLDHAIMEGEINFEAIQLSVEDAEFCGLK